MPPTDHRVELTRDNRFAVVAPDGQTLAEFHGEFAALTAAAALKLGPVRTMHPAGRFTDPEPKAA
jgi:hypothetical protein